MSSYTRLTFEQRLTIERYLHSGISQSAIARKLGVHRSTICNELNRNGGRSCYSARLAQRKAEKNSKRNNVKYRRRVHRFPLNRDVIYSKDEPDFLKARPRAWRFRPYVPIMRWHQKQYEFKLRSQAIQARRQYLHFRKRNHVMEGLSRAYRSLDIFQAYGRHWCSGFERGLCSARYIRRYTVSHEGIVKLHYRNRGITTEDNYHRSVWRGHLRYEFQNPVNRTPRIALPSVMFEKTVSQASCLKYCYRTKHAVAQGKSSTVFYNTFKKVWINCDAFVQVFYALSFQLASKKALKNQSPIVAPQYFVEQR